MANYSTTTESTSPSTQASQGAATSSTNGSQRSKTTIYVNDTFIDTKTQPYATEIYTSLSQLGISTNNEASLNQTAELLLNELGCAISGEPSKGFTLTDDDTETLDNENLPSTAVHDNPKPEKLSATDSFTVPDDPFFQLDDAIPDNYRIQDEEEQQAAAPSFVTITAALSRMKR